MTSKLLIFRRDRNGCRAAVHVDITQPAEPPWVAEFSYPAEMSLEEVRAEIGRQVRAWIAEVIPAAEVSLPDEGRTFDPEAGLAGEAILR